jgi:hypothetical protein
MATMNEKDKLSVEEMRKGELGLERKRRGENHALKHLAKRNRDATAGSGLRSYATQIHKPSENREE